MRWSVDLLVWTKAEFRFCRDFCRFSENICARKMRTETLKSEKIYWLQELRLRREALSSPLKPSTRKRKRQQLSATLSASAASADNVVEHLQISYHFAMTISMLGMTCTCLLKKVVRMIPKWVNSLLTVAREQWWNDWMMTLELPTHLDHLDHRPTVNHICSTPMWRWSNDSWRMESNRTFLYQ